MFYDNELYFLQNVLTKCHLSCQTINPYEIIDDRIDQGLRRLLGGKYENETFFDIFPNIKPATVYRISDVFLCKYIFFELPFCDEKTVFIIGPYLNEDITPQMILEQEEKNKIPPKFSKELEYFYMSLPVIREESHIFAMVDSLAEYIWGGADNFENLDIYRENTAAFIPDILENGTLNEGYPIGQQVMESRYEFENQLIAAVAHGNMRKAENMFTSFSSLALENRTPDRLRNIKNYCIIMNTLFRKAAESGGVHPVYLDSVSSDIAKKIEALHTPTAAQSFMLEILRTYCRLVKQHSTKNLSPLIQSVVVKIENDLTSDLSLNALAEINNISPSYLSARFKKETGQTLTQFVNSKRVSVAKHLLKNTTLQIQTIAQHCGILDLHYFCRIFKKEVGKTPSEYRNAKSFE